MAFSKYMLLVAGIGMFVVAIAIVANDAWLAFSYHRKMAVLGPSSMESQPVRWRTTAALVCLAWAPILIGIGIAIPSETSSLHHPQTHRALVATEMR